MTSIAIFMEGGGPSAGQKDLLRQGMNTFLADLRDRAHRKNWGWKLVPCGSRHETYKAFINERRRAALDEVIILLVDSEEGVKPGSTRAAHLHNRIGDGWTLTGVAEECIHLMVQTMETWIIADPDALATYYGQYFAKNSLPARQDLEEEPKAECAKKLAEATSRTSKGEYRKIRDATRLLKLISPGKVRERCRHADILFSTVEQLFDTSPAQEAST